MKRFASVGHAQLFCSIHDHVYQHFRPPQHHMNAATYRETLDDRHDTRNNITNGILDAAHAS